MLAGPPVPSPRSGVRASLAYRLWGVVSAPVSVALLLTVLTPTEQGQWYTLVGLQRFQAVVELGFGTTFLSVVAHTRDPGRLQALLTLARRWHRVMAVAWGGGASLLGGVWLWQVGIAPWVWVLLCLCTALSMWWLPLQLWREGQGQVGEVFSLRLFQGVSSRVASWAAVLAGLASGGLVVERLVVSLSSMWYSQRAWPQAPAGDNFPVSYRREIFPLQWRVALAMVGGATPWALLVPITLTVGGPEAAGRMGIGLAMLGILQSLSWGLLSPHLPRMAHRRRDGQHAEALSLLRSALRSALGLYGVGIAGGLLLVGIVPWLEIPWLLITPLPWLLLALGGVCRFLREVLTAWSRADLSSPTWVVDVGEGLLFWPLLTWGAGWGELGVSATFCGSALLALGGAWWRVRS